MNTKTLTFALVCALTGAAASVSAQDCMPACEAPVAKSCEMVCASMCETEKSPSVSCDTDFCEVKKTCDADGCPQIKKSECDACELSKKEIMRQLDDYIANLVAGSTISNNMSGEVLYELYKALYDLAVAGAGYYQAGLSDEGVNELAEMMGAALMYGYRSAEAQE